MENRQEFVKDIKVLASNYISREYAIDDLHGRDPSQIWDTADIEVWINALPSVQPDKDLIHLQKEQAYMQGYEDGQKSRKGKWIYHTYIPHRKYCSCCKKDSPYDKFWDFCPNCGCCMEEGDSDEKD